MRAPPGKDACVRFLHALASFAHPKPAAHRRQSGLSGLGLARPSMDAQEVTVAHECGRTDLQRLFGVDDARYVRGFPVTSPFSIDRLGGRVLAAGAQQTSPE